MQQCRLSIMDLQVEEREAQIQRAMVQELASWQTSGSISSLGVISKPFILLMGLCLPAQKPAFHWHQSLPWQIPVDVPAGNAQLDGSFACTPGLTAHVV